MNEAEPLQSRPNAFDAVVRNYVRPLPEKFQTLLPYQDGIAELRSKRASFRTIAQLLKQVGVSVSHDTLARFCHAVIESTQPRKLHRQTNERAATEPTRKQPSTSPTNAVSPDVRVNVSALLQQRRNEPSLPTTIQTPRSGPRIADPKNV